MMANALTTGFHRIIHRARPVPVGQRAASIILYLLLPAAWLIVAACSTRGALNSRLLRPTSPLANRVMLAAPHCRYIVFCHGELGPVPFIPERTWGGHCSDSPMASSCRILSAAFWISVSLVAPRSWASM